MYIVHLMLADKFTLPLKQDLQSLFNSDQHHFLILGQTKKSNSCETVLGNPSPLNVIRNIWHVGIQFTKADLILLHGLPVLYYFLLFPFALKKIAWIIYGGADLYLHKPFKASLIAKFLKALRNLVLKNVKIHLTHIKGDSDLANEMYHSNARWLYHPVYLSNVVDCQLGETIKKTNPKGEIVILVGNSTDPSNHHLEIFEWLKGMELIQIYCPLSYGTYNDYKEKVKQKGFELFGERFIPIEQFMQFEEYKSFLASIDVAIFNHKRQEAMGVTLTLLSLGKEVYVNDNTTSFQSLKERGFQLFSNALITTERSKLATRNVDVNASLLKRYYSKQVWEAQWKQVYNFNSVDEFA